jgi:hypothetical protein
MWSIGVIGFQLLGQRRPFAGEKKYRKNVNGEKNVTVVKATRMDIRRII